MQCALIFNVNENCRSKKKYYVPFKIVVREVNVVLVEPENDVSSHASPLGSFEHHCSSSSEIKLGTGDEYHIRLRNMLISSVLKMNKLLGYHIRLGNMLISSVLKMSKLLG